MISSKTEMHSDVLMYVNYRKRCTLRAVVISKSFSKGGSRCNHAHIFGCGLAAATPIFFKLRYNNLI